MAIELDFVAIIDCLSNDERRKYQITSQLEQDLKAKDIGYATCLCNDEGRVIKFLTELLAKAKEGRKFCINFVSHGNDDCIGFKPSKESLNWEELSTLLEDINIALEGTLLLNMMSCFGLNGIKVNDFKKDQFPCYGVIGSANKLKMSDAKSINKKFYHKLFDGAEINSIIPEIQAEVKTETGRKNVIYCITSQGYEFIQKNKTN
ncbi:MAG: hypothetical protein M3O71_00555 [Bacteroidota bacterium]|nr:hypothetical protein [Bacteroidota bacterium]